MGYRLRLLTPPAREPVEITDARDQCRIRHVHDDGRLARLIASAREQAEAITRRALIAQEWEQTSVATRELVRLERWPVAAVVAVLVDGVPLDSQSFTAELGDDASISSVAWLDRKVTVRYRAGYGEAPSDVPASIRDWMLVKIADAYANPGSVVIGTINSRLDFVDEQLNQFIVPR